MLQSFSPSGITEKDTISLPEVDGVQFIDIIGTATDEQYTIEDLSLVGCWKPGNKLHKIILDCWHTYNIVNI